MERLGRLGDGGKWVCDVDTLAETAADCVIYSFGVRDDVTFEQEIIERSGHNCVVHAFDPSVGGLPQYAKGARNLHFHKSAISAYDGVDPVWPVADSLTGHMHALGHEHLRLLKVDVEGAEWPVFEALLQVMRAQHRAQLSWLLQAGTSVQFDQLLIELHLNNQTTAHQVHELMFNFFEGMEVSSGTLGLA